MNDKVHLLGGKTYKECDLITLPTNSLSMGSLCLIGDNYEIAESFKRHLTNSRSIPHFLYAISDDNITDGDYYINMLQYEEGYYKVNRCNLGSYIQSDRHRKIIASIDKSLELARFSNDFLKKYCQLNGIAKVLIEYQEESRPVTISNGIRSYSESIVELKPKVAADNTITIKPLQLKDVAWGESDVKQLCWEAFTHNMGKIPIHQLDDIVRQFEEWYRITRYKKIM